MKNPKLVVLTGYPTCGKSTVSKFLAQSLGYTRLSGDEISIELFGHTYSYKDDENPERIWERIYKRRDEGLKEGRNLVIDTTAYNERMRKRLFDTQTPADKYLVWLQVNLKTMNKRTVERQWTENSIEQWKNYVGWEDPKQNGYQLLVYQNNNPNDLGSIKDELRKQMKN